MRHCYWCRGGPDAAGTARMWRDLSPEGLPAIHLCAVLVSPIHVPMVLTLQSVSSHQTCIGRSQVHARCQTDFRGYLEDYLAIVRQWLSEAPTSYLRYRCIIPAWDNPRRGNRAHIHQILMRCTTLAWSRCSHVLQYLPGMSGQSVRAPEVPILRLPEKRCGMVLSIQAF